jgi:hypothetical protein
MGVSITEPHQSSSAGRYGFRSSGNFTDCGGFCALSHGEVLWQCDVELMACRRPLSVLVNMIKCGAGRGKGTVQTSLMSNRLLMMNKVGMSAQSRDNGLS